MTDHTPTVRIGPLKGHLLFIYLAVTGARVELPAAISVRSEGEETHFVDSRGVVVAVFRSADVLMYSMTPIEAEPPPESSFSGK